MLFFIIFLSTLSPEYEKFLNYEAYYLILPEEKEVFLKLEEDYQRDIFIEEFWKRRDPFPDTYENEFKDGFLIRLEEATESFGFHDPRTRIYAIFGAPDEIIQINCENYVPSFVWKYKRIDSISSPAILLFFKPYGIGNFKLYEGFDENNLLSEERKEEICFEKIYLDQAISWTKNALLDGKLQIILNPPKVELEDVGDILKRSIIVPEGLEKLKATFSYNFKSGYGGKTNILGTLLFQDENISGIEIKGEILKNKKLYDSFNIKYFFTEISPPFPASFNLNLFPGNYELIIFAKETGGKKGLKLIEKLEVPSVEEKILKEKIEKKFKLKAPLVEVPQKGITYFEVDSPENIRKVKFYLDNKFVAQKNNFPFNIEIDLGSVPLPHIVEAVGLDENENEKERDILFLNQGFEAFQVKIINPRGNIYYYKNVPFKAEILKPETKKIEKLEIYEGDNLLAEFLSQPFEGIISIPYKPQPILRAVAYLDDGRKAEDTVLLNSSGFEETLKISSVNLYTTVLNNNGKPVSGLKKEDFEVFEDKIKQNIIEFKEAKDIPLNICFLIDTSRSMDQYLENIKKAIDYFASNYLNKEDKFSLITFNSTQNLLIPLTNDKNKLKERINSLSAEGYTNLYDAIVFSLYQFQNKKERNVIFLLTDGRDTGSSFTFENTIDYLKHSQVIVYPIAINIKFTDLKIKDVLSQIADVSGGTFFPVNYDEIDYVYKRISQELRTQYLLNYVSSQTSENFRKIEVKVKDGLVAKTISGYFP